MKDFMAQPIEDKLRERLVNLPDFVTDFIYWIENSKEIQTLFEYTKDLQLFLEFLSTEVFGVPVQSITLKEIDQVTERNILDYLSYIKKYKKTYVKDATTTTRTHTNTDISRNRKLATLHMFYAELEKRNLVTKDPSKYAEIKVKKNVKIKTRLTKEEIYHFFDCIKDDVSIEKKHARQFHQLVSYRDYVISLVLAFSGIRISELVQLDISDISLGEDNCMVVLRKGGDEQRLPLNPVLRDELAAYLLYRQELQALDEPAHRNALFLSLQKKRIHPKTVRVMLEKYRARSGISIKITPHSFRRTFGTMHYNQFNDMFLTAQILGHKSAETTRQFYADPDESRLRDSMNNFDY